MNKLLVIGSLFVVFLLLPTTNYQLTTVHAADSTSSATPSASIKTKLEELKKEIASKAAKLKTEINQKLQNKAYVGTITSKSDASITVATINGPKIINVNQDSQFETKLKLKKKFSLETLKEEDYIAALGDIDENNVLTAKKIILLPLDSAPQPLTVLWGQVSSISNSQIAIKDRNLKNYFLVMSGKTIFQKGGEEITINDLRTNNFIITTGSVNTNGTINSDYLYVIPTGGILKTKKVATPSAETRLPDGQVSTSGKKN